METLQLIGWISGIALVAFGFVHLIILEKIFQGKPSYLRMKWWVGKITLGLTIIFFGSGLTMLVIFFFSK